MVLEVLFYFCRNGRCYCGLYLFFFVSIDLVSVGVINVSYLSIIGIIILLAIQPFRLY